MFGMNINKNRDFWNKSQIPGNKEKGKSKMVE
jgi:hypothetical protein